ncbi:MAG: class I SAM-dependent methyltransferase [Candidatus Omnitrophica bacterium]|nr:class I SAM-dependent methyltransferase [Candidatus Omnitrophota bacterium]
MKQITKLLLVIILMTNSGWAHVAIADDFIHQSIEMPLWSVDIPSFLSPRLAIETSNFSKVWMPQILRVSDLSLGVSENTLKLVSEQPQLREFIEKFLKKRYTHWGLSDNFASDIINILLTSAQDNLIAREQVDKLRAKTNWDESYGKYQQALKYNATYEQIQPRFQGLAKGSVIMDVGTGKGALAFTIAENLEHVNVKGIEFPDKDGNMIQEYNRDNLEFKMQTSPMDFIYPDDSVDIIVMNAVFHHIADEYIEDCIKEIHRVLKPGGKIILIEDTYSVELEFDKESDQELTEEFVGLVKKYGEQFAIDFFAFNDWYANYIIRHDDMPLPYKFRSIEKWGELFTARNFSASFSHHIGFPAAGFHKPGLGIVEFTAEQESKQIKKIFNNQGKLNKDGIVLAHAAQGSPDDFKKLINLAAIERSNQIKVESVDSIKLNNTDISKSMLIIEQSI